MAADPADVVARALRRREALMKRLRQVEGPIAYHGDKLAGYERELAEIRVEWNELEDTLVRLVPDFIPNKIGTPS